MALLLLVFLAQLLLVFLYVTNRATWKRVQPENRNTPQLRLYNRFTKSKEAFVPKKGKLFSDGASDHIRTIQAMIFGKKSSMNTEAIQMTSPLGKETLREARAYQTMSKTPVVVLKNDKYLSLVFEKCTTSRGQLGCTFSTQSDEGSYTNAFETPSLLSDEERSHSTFYTAHEERLSSNDIFDETDLTSYINGLSDEITFLMPWTKGNDTLSHNAYKEGNFPSCSTPASEGNMYEAELPSILYSPIKKRPFEGVNATKSSHSSNPYVTSIIRSSKLTEENRNRAKKGSTETGFSQPSSLSSTRSRIDYSKAEENALVNGLRKYGKRFRKIWFAYNSDFHPKRTPVSLYDKYRHDKKIRMKARATKEL